MKEDKSGGAYRTSREMISAKF